MSAKYANRLRTLRIAYVVAAAGLVGCGSDVEMAPVHGVVTMNDKPVGNVLVVFQPQAAPGKIEAPTRPSMATADDQGRYQLSTKVEGDGAAVGTHSVSIAAASGESSPPGKLPSGFTVEVKSGENSIDLELEPN
jgi:hypothetical protein